MEVGPGHAPFPTATGARVTFCDRSVPGGRDVVWPELVGEPHGPDADVIVDLDVDGLRAVPSEHFDSVVASHVVEHLANPVFAIAEFWRVLRPDGRLVLIVPDRSRTFDSVRSPTPVAHVFEDFDREVVETDEDHIREFCEAIYTQPPIHPPAVREWYHPGRLDAQRVELHRLRTIHVHCWSPEEFAVVIVAGIARGAFSWRLADLYFWDDTGEHPQNEFGLVLRKDAAGEETIPVATAFASEWAACAAERPKRGGARVGAFVQALHGATLDGHADAVVRRMTEALVARSQALMMAAQDAERRVESVTHDAGILGQQLNDAHARLSRITASRSYRLARTMSSTYQNGRHALARLRMRTSRTAGRSRHR